MADCSHHMFEFEYLNNQALYEVAKKLTDNFLISSNKYGSNLIFTATLVTLVRHSHVPKIVQEFQGVQYP